MLQRGGRHRHGSAWVRPMWLERSPIAVDSGSGDVPLGKVVYGVGSTNSK